MQVVEVQPDAMQEQGMRFHVMERPRAWNPTWLVEWVYPMH